MKRPVALLTSLFFSGYLSAELSPMSDDAMSEVDGSGLGIVLEDFSFHAGSQTDNQSLFRIEGIKTSDGQEVKILANNVFIGGKDSASFVQNSDGTTSFAVHPTTTNIGRLADPLEIRQRDGDDVDVKAPNKGVLEIALPELKAIPGDEIWTGQTMGPCLKGGVAACTGNKFTSREADGSYRGERIDIGLDLSIAFEDSPGSGTFANDTPLTLYVKEAVLDGSYVRMWGDETATGTEIQDDQKRITMSNIRLNLYTPELFIASCGPQGNNCGGSVHIKHLALDLVVGVGEIQPAMLSVNADGHFQLEVQALPNPTTVEGQRRLAVLEADMPDAANWVDDQADSAAHPEHKYKAFYDNYYNDTIPGVKTKSHLYIGDPTVSSPTFETAGGLMMGDTYLGTAKVEGLQFQYLKLTTQDINNQ
jgi:hypothetical protein